MRSLCSLLFYFGGSWFLLAMVERVPRKVGEVSTETLGGCMIWWWQLLDITRTSQRLQRATCTYTPTVRANLTVRMHSLALAID